MDWEGVRRLALSFPPDTSEKLSFGSPHWRVHDKGFVWERPLRKVDLAHLGLAEQPGPVLGVRVEDEGTKFALIEEDPRRVLHGAALRRVARDPRAARPHR